MALCLNLVQSIYNEVDDESDPRRYAANRMIFLGGGSTLLTLIINGTSAGLVLGLLGLSTPPIPDETRKHIFEGTAKDFVYTQLMHLLEEDRFKNVRFDVLKDVVPFVTKEPTRKTIGSESSRRCSAVRRFNETVGKLFKSTSLPTSLIIVVNVFKFIAFTVLRADKIIRYYSNSWGRKAIHDANKSRRMCLYSLVHEETQDQAIDRDETDFFRDSSECLRSILS